MGVTYFLLLSCIGLAITVQAQDCSKPLAGPNMDLKGSDSLLQTFPDGTQVSFACDPGYMSAGGSAVITCNAGTWTPVKLKCEKRNCGSAGEVNNGHIDYPTGNDFGDYAVITCNEGYRLVGKSKILCGVQGWDARLPECEVVTCDLPPMVEQGTFSPKKETYKFNDVVQYSCQNNYTLDGSKSLSCSEDGTFVPAPPKCIKVQCGDAVIKNAKWVEGSRPPYGYKATVTYQCISGYVMTGPSTLTCEMNSQWSPGLPECKEKGHCGEPVIKNAKWVDGSRPPYGYKATVTYQCISGYVMTGPSTLTCEMNSQWSPGLPECNNSNVLGITLGVLGVIVIIITACGCYHCGFLAFIKKKQRKRCSPVTPTLLDVKRIG